MTREEKVYECVVDASGALEAFGQPLSDAIYAKVAELQKIAAVDAMAMLLTRGYFNGELDNSVRLDNNREPPVLYAKVVLTCHGLPLWNELSSKEETTSTGG